MDNLKAMATDPICALELGKAAEHLVCADLLLRGFTCCFAGQGSPYDVVVDTSQGLVRVQVKATCFPRNMAAKGRAPHFGYRFSVRRRGKGGSQRLSKEHCDAVALVALDIRAIAYLPLHEAGQTVQLMPPGHAFRGNFVRERRVSITELPFEAALERLRV